MSSRSRRQKRGRNANHAGNRPRVERQQTGPRTAKPEPHNGFSAWLTKSIPVIRGIATVIHAIVELIRAFQSYQTRQRLSVGCIYQAESPVH